MTTFLLPSTRMSSNQPKQYTYHDPMYSLFPSDALEATSDIPMSVYECSLPPASMPCLGDGMLGSSAPWLAPVHAVLAWTFLCRTIEDHDTLFVLAEVAHFVGIGLLGFKMYSKRSAAGVSCRQLDHSKVLQAGSNRLPCK